MAEAGLRAPDREVSWPVTMRATPPMLPHVDEGALVLLPAATLAEVRPSLPGALRELRRRGVAALVLDASGGAHGNPPLLDADGLDLLRLKEPEGRVGPELEVALARLLNGRRAQLYRRGTEIDRALTEATLRGQGVAQLLAIGAAQSGRDLFLLDERGRVREAGAPAGRAEARPPAPPLGVDAPPAPLLDPASGLEWLLFPLDGAAAGWVALRGPLGALDEVDRLLGLRVAAACALALGRGGRAPGVARLAPGRRAALTAELLRADLPPAERIAHAEALGLDPAAAYTVLLLGQRERPPAPAARRQTGAPPAPERPLQALRRSLAAATTRAAQHAGEEPFDVEPAGALGLLLHAPDRAALRRVILAVRPLLTPPPVPLPRGGGGAERRRGGGGVGGVPGGARPLPDRDRPARGCRAARGLLGGEGGHADEPGAARAAHSPGGAAAR